jgi:site-specific DNA-methyltransferase (adenine-specific)
MTKTRTDIDTITLGRYEEEILHIPTGSIDLLLTDPPYGVTDCAWDIKPKLDFMWQEFNRVLKDNGAAVVTATQPFATEVINANRKYFRYDLVWAKSNPVGYLNAKRMPLRQHELVLVFYRKLPTYNPQMVPGEFRESRSGGACKPGVYANYKSIVHASNLRYPTSLLPIDKEGAGPGRHPTQKPLALFEYLVLSYSNPGEIVFDPFMGSGTTAVAAKRTGRHYLGFEAEREYWEMANCRLDETAIAKQNYSNLSILN